MDYGGNGLGAPSKRGRTAVGVTRIGLGSGGLDDILLLLQGLRSLIAVDFVTEAKRAGTN